MMTKLQRADEVTIEELVAVLKRALGVIGFGEDNLALAKEIERVIKNAQGKR